MMQRKNHRSLLRNTVAQQLMLEPTRARHYLQSEWTAPGGGTASLTIDVTSDDNGVATGAFVAPTAVRLHARPTGFAVSERTLPSHLIADTPGTASAQVYDESFHEIEYFWEVTTSPAGYADTFVSLGRPGNAMNQPTAYNTKKKRIGKYADFVFDVPGNYTVSLWAVDANGTTATATQNFTVTSIESFLSNPAHIICVNPAGDSDFSWAPAGATQVTGATDRAAAESAASQYMANGNRALYFKPGASYDLTGTGTLLDPGTNSLSNKTRGWIGTPLGETPAEISISTWFYREFRLTNLVSLAIFNMKLSTSSASKALALEEHYTQKLVHQVSFDGFNQACVFTSNPNFPEYEDGMILLSEVFVTNWGGYGIFANPMYTALAPNDDMPSFKTKVGMLAMDWKFGTGQVSEGCYRFGYIEEFNMSHCHAYHNAPNPGGTMQPVCRMFNNGTILGDTDRPRFPWCIITRNAMEGGSWTGIHALLGNDNGTGTYPFGKAPINTLVDQNIHIAVPNIGGHGGTKNFIGATDEGLPTACTIRNCLFVGPPGANNIAAAFRWGTDTANGNDVFFFSNPVKIYGNTAVVLRSTGTPGLEAIDQKANYTDVAFENNVFHAPNLAAPTDAGLVASTLSGLTVEHTTFADTLWTPGAGSSALNGYSSGGLGTWDVLGTVRSGKVDPKTGSTASGVAELGAVEA